MTLPSGSADHIRLACRAVGASLPRKPGEAMKWFNFFWPAPRISDAESLRNFLDRHSAFMVQKSVFEYSRARSGLLSTKLFKEPDFVAAADRARWRNYPLCLQVHVLMAYFALRPHAGAQTGAMQRALIATVQDICESYPVPDGFEPEFWTVAAERIKRRIALAGMAGPKPVKDLPREIAEEFFRNMPIHGDLRGCDFELITNNVRVNLCRAHENLGTTADLGAVAVSLITAADHPGSRT